MSPLLFNLYTESLITRVVDSGIGCYVGDVCAAILMYADDIALLAPSRTAMQKLLDICDDFGGEFQLEFNPDKSESIIFGRNKYVTNLFLNNKLIPNVNHVNYLGHHLHNKIQYTNDIFCLQPLIADIKTRTNVILSYFNFLTIDSKIRIFNVNTSSYYGCVLTNQFDNSLEALDRAWRVCCRKILGLPPRTHCDLVPPLMAVIPPSNQINKRTIKFFKDGINNKSYFINYFFEHCLFQKESIMYFNLKKISENTYLPISNLMNLSNAQLKKVFYKETSNWKSKIVKELLYSRERQLNCSLDEYEIGLILNEICTN